MLNDNLQDPVPPFQLAEYRLVRRIGRGAYGEVWLAWNALGGACAVKMVHRGDFEDERPYEREFEGIRRYEPTSRYHPNLVQVLHVGRNDELKFFYYVMELADSEDPGIGPKDSAYVPRTLRGEVRRRGRLKAAECATIALGLAGALQHLHDNHLVHRDVKPSNIVFVRGVPRNWRTSDSWRDATTHVLMLARKGTSLPRVPARLRPMSLPWDGCCMKSPPERNDRITRNHPPALVRCRTGPS